MSLVTKTLKKQEMFNVYFEKIIGIRHPLNIDIRNDQDLGMKLNIGVQSQRH